MRGRRNAAALLAGLVFAFLQGAARADDAPFRLNTVAVDAPVAEEPAPEVPKSDASELPWVSAE